MIKTLESGIIVNSDEFYLLLEWRDNNRVSFRAFLQYYNQSNESINLMDKHLYNNLLHWSSNHFD